MTATKEIASHFDGEVCIQAMTTKDCDRSHRWLLPSSQPQCDRDGIAMSMNALLNNGWDLFQVWDGEEYVDIFDNNQNTALDAIMAVDGATLKVRRPAADLGGIGYESGWVYFVLGNAPWEVICDHTTNLSHALDSLMEGWS